jgi:peroxiredoxin
MRVALILASLLVFIASVAFAQTADEPSPPPAATAPTTTPAEVPATASSVPADVKPLLDQFTRACAETKSLQLEGKISLRIESAQEPVEHSGTFASSYRSPGLFRHETKDDLLLVSGAATGGTKSKGFAYLPARNSYAEFDAPKKQDTLLDELPDQVVHVLMDQDPLLALMLSPDAGKLLIEGADDVKKSADVQISGSDCPAVSFKRNSTTYRVAFDPATHLVRQFQLDETKRFVDRGADDAKLALVTIDYTKVAAGAPVADAEFTWSPPKEAVAMKLAAEQEPGGAGEAMALVGKPAPDFTLKGLDGKPVALSRLRGNVVVLDFWATWCGPCVASLPHLDQLYKDRAEQGLKLYAIDQDESADTVKKFLESKGLTLPVLLDPKSSVGEKYKVEGIPQTVVIGKDGTVKKVMIGFGGDDTELRKAVDQALNH